MLPFVVFIAVQVRQLDVGVFEKYYKRREYKFHGVKQELFSCGKKIMDRNQSYIVISFINRHP